MNEVQIVVKGRDESKAAYSSATKGSEKFGKATEGAKRSLGLFKLAAGAVAAGGLVGFLKESNAQARESQKVGAQTAAVIKSTGGAAGLTAKQFGDLATAISNKTGIDDEQIQSSENVLATFTGLRNEVGKGNDIFSQATQTVTDMSVALGQDTKNSAIQLGKALNDPITGITALSRVGVTFTKQQKDQIKTLVDSGNTLGAQKIILGELTKEFGGSAAAQATAGDKLKTVWKNVEEQIGTALLPILDKLASWASQTLLPAFSKAVVWVQTNWPKIAAVIAAAWNSYIRPVWAATISFIRDKLIPGIKAVVQWVRDHWPEIKSAVSTAWGQIKPLLQAFIDMVKTLWHDAIQPIVRWVRDNWPTISKVLKVVAIVVGVALWTMVTSAKLAFKAIGAAIKVVNAAWRLFGAPIAWAWNHVIKPVINAIMTAIHAAQAALDVLTNKPIKGHGTYVPGGAPQNQPGRYGDTHGHASGGVFSGGTIDERGPEIRRLPNGTMIYPAGQSAGMAAKMAGGFGVVRLEVVGGGSEFERFMAEFIRRFVRVKGGGDVQTAFGR